MENREEEREGDLSSCIIQTPRPVHGQTAGLATKRVGAGLDMNGPDLDQGPTDEQQGNGTAIGVEGLEAAATGNRQGDGHGAHVLSWQ
uniref:DUF834 domain-containing protein n=1 Tax=Oryza brachyantha TaxID=4533 RepID=J3KZW1_ORYBR